MGTLTNHLGQDIGPKGSSSRCVSYLPTLGGNALALFTLPVLLCLHLIAVLLHTVMFCTFNPTAALSTALRMGESAVTYTVVQTALVPGRLLLRAYRSFCPRVDNGSYQVFVQTGEGILAFDVEQTDTIGNLKRRIFFRNNWMVEHQRLIYGRKQLADDTALATAGVGKRAMLHLVGRLRGGMPTASSSSMSWRPAKPAQEALGALPDYKLDLSKPQPPWLGMLPIQLTPRIPLRNFYFLLNITEKDFENMRPDEKADASRRPKPFKGWGAEERRKEYNRLQCMMSQPSTREGDHILMPETYDLPKSGFPGRLYSGGINSLWHCFRSILLEETADLDMDCCRQRIYVWVCAQYGFDAKETKRYVANKSAIRAAVAREEGVNVKVAKEMLNAVSMSDKPQVCKGPTLKAIDTEAKEMQKHVYALPALQWIKTSKAYVDKLEEKEEANKKEKKKENWARRAQGFDGRAEGAHAGLCAGDEALRTGHRVGGQFLDHRLAGGGGSESRQGGGPGHAQAAAPAAIDRQREAQGRRGLVARSRTLSLGIGHAYEGSAGRSECGHACWSAGGGHASRGDG